MGQYAERVTLAMHRSGEDAHLIFLADRLHDIGKCAVHNEVLLKPGPLTEEEREHMCTHAPIGGKMLDHFPLFHECVGYVRGHHERWDGEGYPDGLAREGIPFGARVIAVVDSYDAMTTTRPYRRALPHVEAVRRLRVGAGSQWDPDVVDAFLVMMGEAPTGLGTAAGPAKLAVGVSAA